MHLSMCESENLGLELWNIVLPLPRKATQQRQQQWHCYNMSAVRDSRSDCLVLDLVLLQCERGTRSTLGSTIPHCRLVRSLI